MKCKDLLLILAFSFSLSLSLSCSKKSDSFNDSIDNAEGPSIEVPAAKKTLLYVASGSCYTGGVAASSGSSTVAAFDNKTGTLKRVIIDYNAASPGDSPIGILDYDEKRILVLVENTSGRRIDLVLKDGSGFSTYLVNSAALSGVVRSLLRQPDNTLLISKSTAIEKFSAAKSRITQGANPYINAPGGACSPSITLISSVATLGNGAIVFAHSAATPNNRIGIISASGYATASDCLSTQAAPATTALPTSMIYHSSGKLLVGYGSTTAASNSIYAYDVNETTKAISNATAAFSDVSIVNGPSVVMEDKDTGNVYVANGAAAFNTVERFSFDASTKKLTRIENQPFLLPQVYTRCITDMKVISE